MTDAPRGSACTIISAIGTFETPAGTANVY
jgi:hypothetical protein